MKIIKENLFVVILLAVVVVGAGVSLVLAGSYDRTRDKELQERKGLGDQLSSQERQKINERKVKLAESRVKRMKEMVETATAQTSLRSRHDYKVLDFAVGAKSVAAFPVDPSVGDRNELRLKFPKRYREQALAMLAAMRPAEAPSEKDIKDALDKLQGITSGDSTRGATRNPYDDEAIRRP